MLISKPLKKSVVPVLEKGNYRSIMCNKSRSSTQSPPQKRSSTPDAPAKKLSTQDTPTKEEKTPSTAIYDHYDQSYWFMQVSDQTSNNAIFPIF